MISAQKAFLGQELLHIYRQPPVTWRDEARKGILEPCEALWLLREGCSGALDHNVGSKVSSAHSLRNFLASHYLAEEACKTGMHLLFVMASSQSLTLR